MKKYRVLVLAMSTFPDPWRTHAFDNRYVFKERDKNGNLTCAGRIYHGIGQLEPTPLLIFDKYGPITHYIILQTDAAKESLGHNWEKINESILSEDGDGYAIKYTADESISSVDFFEKRIQTIHSTNGFLPPEFIHIDMPDGQPDIGLAKLMGAVSSLYAKCVKNNNDCGDDECWQLFLDVHGGPRDAALAMFALIQTLSAPDEQELKTGRIEDKKIDTFIAHITDGKQTIPITCIYTIQHDPNNKDPKKNPYAILDKTDFFSIFTKQSLEAYMNYGQYAQMALKSTIKLDSDTIPAYSFISYRRMDAPKERFVFLGILKKQGYRYWYDDSIPLMDNWQTILEEAVDKCSFFFALITKNYYSSYQCVKELKQAIDRKKTIMLVSLDGSDLYLPNNDITPITPEGEEPITITRQELETVDLSKRQQIDLGNLIRDGVFQSLSLEDKLSELCKKNEEFKKTNNTKTTMYVD